MHYSESDDGKVIDGKTVVWIHLPAGESGGSETSSSKTAAETPAAAQSHKISESKEAVQDRKLEHATMTAQSLQAAAQKGKPFCVECEAAKQRLKAKR